MQNPDFYGSSFNWFIGIVTDVIDDSFVRVRAFGVHNMHDRTKLPDTDLPPAIVLLPTTGGQAGSGAFGHNLTVDSWVWGFFADGSDAQHPVVVAVINGSQYSMSTYSSQGGEFVEDVSYDPNSPIPDVDTGATTNIPGGSNTAKSYNYIYQKLVAEGSSNDPHLHASAAVGVLLLETSGINPAVTNSIGAYGICQWLGSRRTQLFRQYGKTKRLDQQLDFMWWELNNTEKKAKSRWLQATSMPDAVAGFAQFERAEEWQNGRIVRSHPNYKKRLQFAYGVYNSATYDDGTQTA